MERDLVCGMQLRPGQEEASFVYQDNTYHFCSQECCKRFQAHPQEFLKDAERENAQTA